MSARSTTAPPLSATAHGKVILGGEHAVVYGCPALAGAIPNALHLEAQRGAAADTLTLDMPCWELARSIDCARQGSDDLLDRALLAVFAACDTDPKGWQLRGDSRLWPGAGLGSSAALCVALAKLLLGQGASDDKILAAAMAGEQVFHGKASGIDTQLALSGGILRFCPGQSPTALGLNTPINLWVVHSKSPRQSAAMVQGVAARLERLPALAPPMWSLFTSLVDQQQEAILGHDLKQLGEIMQVLHELLSALGVSTPRLDQICSAAMAAGALGAKLTGAGGGGCVLVLPPADTDKTRFAAKLDRVFSSIDGGPFIHHSLQLLAS